MPGSGGNEATWRRFISPADPDPWPRVASQMKLRGVPGALQGLPVASTCPTDPDPWGKWSYMASLHFPLNPASFAAACPSLRHVPRIRIRGGNEATWRLNEATWRLSWTGSRSGKKTGSGIPLLEATWRLNEATWRLSWTGSRSGKKTGSGIPLLGAASVHFVDGIEVLFLV